MFFLFHFYLITVSQFLIADRYTALQISGNVPFKMGPEDVHKDEIVINSEHTSMISVRYLSELTVITHSVCSAYKVINHKKFGEKQTSEKSFS